MNLVVEGNVKGQILGIPRGDNGFGYDPLFYVPNWYMMTLTVEQKKISHRAKAIENLEDKWKEWMLTRATAGSRLDLADVASRKNMSEEARFKKQRPLAPKGLFSMRFVVSDSHGIAIFSCS